MPTVNNILSKTPASINSSDFKQLTKDLQTAAAGVIAESKFENRAQVQGSGYDRKYDQLQGVLARTISYETNIPIVNSRLNSKQMALNDIRAVLTDFDGKSSDLKTSITPAEKANAALAKIANILNRKDGARYIFGGKNDNVPPVAGDITNLNEQNFTNVTSNENKVEIAEEVSVDINMVTARDVAPAIKFINAYKNSGDRIDDPELEILRQDVLKQHEHIQVRIGNAIEEVKSASDINADIVTNAKETIIRDFSPDLYEQTINFKNTLHSLMVNISTSYAMQRAQDEMRRQGIT